MFSNKNILIIYCLFQTHEAENPCVSGTNKVQFDIFIYDYLCHLG